MSCLRTLLLAGAMAGLGFAGTMAPAMADPLDTTFTVNVWNFKCATSSSTCNRNSQNQKALPTNPKASGTPTIAGATYTGAMDFDLGKGGANNVGAFFSSAPGGTGTASLFSYSNNKLSTGQYPGNQWTTLISFDFTIGASTNAIFHDDGVSLFNQGDTTVADDLLPLANANPTTAADSDITLPAGSYTLWYVEANGLPAVLKFDTTPDPVPEPGSMALLGTALIGFGILGFAVRKRRPTICQ